MHEPDDLLQVEADELTQEIVYAALRSRYSGDIGIYDKDAGELDSEPVIDAYLNEETSETIFGVSRKGNQWFADQYEIRECDDAELDDEYALYFVALLEIVAVKPGRTLVEETSVEKSPRSDVATSFAKQRARTTPRNDPPKKPFTYRDLLIFAFDYDDGTLRVEADTAEITFEDDLEHARTSRRIAVAVGILTDAARSQEQPSTYDGITLKHCADSGDDLYHDDEEDTDEDEGEPVAAITIVEVETVDAGVVTMAFSRILGAICVDKMEAGAMVEDVRQILLDRCQQDPVAVEALNALKAHK